MKHRSVLAAAALVLLASGAFAAEPAPASSTPPPPAPDLSEAAINGATFEDFEARTKAKAEAATTAPPASETDPVAGKIEAAEGEDAKDPPDPFLIRMQVLLDRAHASPGVIDGRDGGNTAKAVKAFAEMRDLKSIDRPNDEFWSVLETDKSRAAQQYTITEDDLKQRYVGSIPDDYAELAKMDWAGYRDVVEMLAERFHMDEDLLRTLNPGADFGKAGTRLLVADPGPDPETKVRRIVVDKDRGEVFAYAKDKTIVLAFPATIGSPDTPSPSGTMKVNGRRADPEYAYDPKINFTQGKNRKELTLPPGPNGPVGNMWIDLAKPTYGIHGTPEPSKIDKTASHGCVRLTNWDAQALAKLVLPAQTIVEFKG